MADDTIQAAGMPADISAVLPGLQDLQNLIVAGQQAVSQIGQTIGTISGDTRCVLGKTIVLTVPDSDPSLWIGQVGSGINVKSLPDWLDVCDVFGGGADVILYGYTQLGLRSPEAWQALAASDPMTSVGGSKTFDQLTGAQQRAYMANVAAIGAAQAVSDLELYRPIFNQIVAQQQQLGWLDPGSPAGAAAISTGGVDAQSGTPVQITTPDIQGALARVAAARSGAFAQTGANGTESRITDAELRACIELGTQEEKERCLRDTFDRDPDKAILYASLVDPWREMADPEPLYQEITPAPDNRNYSVIRIPFTKKQIGIRRGWFWTGAVAATGLGIAGTVMVVKKITEPKKKKRGRRRG